MKAAVSTITAPSESAALAKPTNKVTPIERASDGIAKSARQGASVNSVPPSAGQKPKAGKSVAVNPAATGRISTETVRIGPSRKIMRTGSRFELRHLSCYLNVLRRT